MTTQESEVDVLAVMDESVAAIEVGEYPGTALALADARAAVAEVFEAVKECHATELGEMACLGSMAPCEHALGRLFTALRNAGVKP